MAEISNKTLAVLVIAALVVVVAGALLNNGSFNKLTGFASWSQGTVNLSVSSSLNIQVDAGNSTINFGACTPQGGTSYWCATNDTAACSGTPSAGNCTGDNASTQYIRVQNIGNINASVNVTSTCTAATLIGGTSPSMKFYTDSCNGTNVTTWTTFGTTTALACPIIVPTTGTFRFYVNVTIPQDATGVSGGCTSPSTLTFQAI